MGEDMIERVALAICEADCGRVTPNELDRCRGLAVAAIEAIRLPTAAMNYAGGIKCEEMMFGGDAEYTGVIFTDMGTVFRTMVDVALTHTHSGEPG